MAWFLRLVSSLISCDLWAFWSSVGLCLAEPAWELLVLVIRACLHLHCHLSGGLVPHRCLSSQVNNFLWSSNFGPMSPFDQYSAVWFWIHSSYRPRKKDDLAAAWTLGVCIPQRCPSLAWRSGWHRGSTGFRSEKLRVSSHWCSRSFSVVYRARASFQDCHIMVFAWSCRAATAWSHRAQSFAFSSSNLSSTACLAKC